VPRFYVEGPLQAGSHCTLSEETAHHAIHVLRAQAGDEATLFDGRGGEYAARIASIQKLRVMLDVLEHRAVERESPLRVVLVQGISSGERMEFTIRKAVELGVTEIRPVLAAGSVARPKGDRAASRQAHWQKIAISACEQCGRNQIPVVHPLGELPAGIAPGTLGILLSPGAAVPFTKVAGKGELAFTIAAGPEAGFSDREEASFVDSGFVPARLGARVLRTETAALAALAALSALKGDF
jgi:16S rRNA (uracil1498-N3)-methyltransferase